MKYMPIKQSQIEDAIDLRIKYFHEAYSEFSLEEENDLRVQIKDYLKEHLNHDCFILVAKEDGKAISTAILNVHTKAPNKRIPKGKIGEIYGVYTLKEYRKRGYATLLIQDLIKLGHELGLAHIELDASSDGLNVYQRCGFLKNDNNQYTKMIYKYE